MATPIVTLEDLRNPAFGLSGCLIYVFTCNDRYIIEVRDEGGGSGMLYAFDHARDGVEIFSQKVDLLALLGGAEVMMAEWLPNVDDFIFNKYEYR